MRRRRVDRLPPVGPRRAIECERAGLTRGPDIQLADVGASVGQVRGLLAGRLSEQPDSELGNGLEQLRSLRETLAELRGRLAQLQLVSITQDLAVIRKELGIATNAGSRRASTIEAQISALESTQPETDEVKTQTASLSAEIVRLKAQALQFTASLQTQRERVLTLAAQVRQLIRALAHLSAP